MEKRADYTAANRAAWDASAAAFGATDEWGAMLRAASEPGFSELDSTMTGTLRALNLSGARAVQVGCNNGRELLSLPSLGIAPALGIDQSAAFLDQARRLSAAAGSECDFLCADVYNLPAGLGPFDLGLITIGVLNWMPDLPGFFRAVSDLLAPGATLVIYETHPFLEMFEPEAADPFAIDRSYFERAPMTWSETITYDGSPGTPSPRMFWFTHTLGEVLTGCIESGLRIERLTEHPHSNREVEYDMYEGRAAQMPLCYTLVARKI